MSNCKFDFCVFDDAKLESSIFEGCTFEGSDLEGTTLRNCSFSSVNFCNIFGLVPEQLENKSVTFKNESLISNDFYQTCAEFFVNGKINVDFKVTSEEDPFDYTEFRQLFDSEKIELSNFSPNWPDESEFLSVTEWSDPSRNQIHDLNKNNKLFKFISYFTHLTSDAYSYAACKLEDARLKKALKQGFTKTAKFVHEELLGKGPPSHEGRAESITIEKVSLSVGNWRVIFKSLRLSDFYYYRNK